MEHLIGYINFDQGGDAATKALKLYDGGFIRNLNPGGDKTKLTVLFLEM